MRQLRISPGTFYQTRKGCRAYIACELAQDVCSHRRFIGLAYLIEGFDPTPLLWREDGTSEISNFDLVCKWDSERPPLEKDLKTLVELWEENGRRPVDVICYDFGFVGGKKEGQAEYHLELFNSQGYAIGWSPDSGKPDQSWWVAQHQNEKQWVLKKVR